MKHERGCALSRFWGEDPVLCTCEIIRTERKWRKEFEPERRERLRDRLRALGRDRGYQDVEQLWP
jgi:hypothetical protein